MIPDFVLASGSAIRRRLLSDAGVRFDVVHPDVDEARVLNDMRSDGIEDAAELASALAAAKALSVKTKSPEKLVLGCDQILEFGGAILTKVDTIDQAVDRLERLNGSEHRLVSGYAIVRDGTLVRKSYETVRVTMRKYSSSVIESYVRRNAPRIFSSVTCYEIEREGAQLIEEIHGDYFAALGLPMLRVFSEILDLEND
ncbi:MAG: Maf family protein [Pseudomonadota bacterium]